MTPHLKHPMWQHELTLPDGTTLVCWLDQRLVRGQQVTLREIPNVQWTVGITYSQPSEKDALHKPWRVGGIA